MKNPARLFQMALLACALLQDGFATGQAVNRAQPITAQEGAKMRTENQAATEQPFFCDLTAIDASQRKHHKELTGRLRESVKEVREMADGYAFRFAGETDQ